MTFKMYSIRDTKTETYQPPWCKSTHGEAEREFRTVCNDKNSRLNMYPEDFDLYYLGEYDDVSGKMKCEDSPQHIIKAVQCINKKDLEAVQ